MTQEDKINKSEAHPEDDKAEPIKTSEGAVKKTPKKKKARRTIGQGNVYVLATFNNTIVTVTDKEGNVLSSASSGEAGFRGSKKGTAYAAQVAAEKALSEAVQNYGLAKVDVSVRGVGLGREAAIRTLTNQKIQMESIRDITSIPHGGVRPRKPKRN